MSEKDYESRLRLMTIAEIKKGLALGRFGDSSYREYKLAKFVLEEKEAEQINERLNTNLKFSKNLVKATLYLALVTALLVIITAIKK